MKLSVDASRIIEDVFLKIPDLPEINDEFYDDLGLETTTSVTERFPYFQKKYDGEISLTAFRKLWRRIELIKFFNSKCQVFTTPIVDINFKSTRARVKRIIPNNNQMISLELYDNPRIILIGKTSVKSPSLMSKMTVSELSTDLVYWLPKKGLLFAKIHNDNSGKHFLEGIEEFVCGKLEEIRFKSLDLTNYFKMKKKITRVKISFEEQITGFPGLSHMQLQGKDVKRGVYGLQQRQEVDIRGIDKVGPNIEIWSDDLSLFIGAPVIIRSIKGIEDLIELITNKEN